MDSSQKEMQVESVLDNQTQKSRLLNGNDKTNISACKVANELTNQCMICCQLISVSKMSNHLKNHARQQAFKCAECGKILSTKSRLKNHHLEKHLKRELKCPLASCQRIFYNRSILQTHIQVVHGNGEKHKCDKCEKSFVYKHDLNVHIKGVHDGLKSYCSFCGKEFIRASEKNRHEKQVHMKVPLETDKPYRG